VLLAAADAVANATMKLMLQVDIDIWHSCDVRRQHVPLPRVVSGTLIQVRWSGSAPKTGR